MNKSQIYDLKITTLTPIHIGSGVELLNEYDFAIHNGRTWRLNDTAVLNSRMPENDAEIADRLSRTPPGNLLDDRDFEADKPFFRYVLNGVPRSGEEGAKLREQLKDIEDKPYIPGSSFKGGLRTAIAWYAWGAEDMSPSAEDIYEHGRARPAKFAGQVYEQPLFVGDTHRRGKEANYDLFRALLVSDSPPAAQDRLAVLNTQVFKHDGDVGTPIEVEAILPNTEFHLPVKIDEALFSNWAKKHGLNMKHPEWIRNFAQSANAHSKARAQDEVKWLTGLVGTKRIVSFYNEIIHRNLQENQFLLQFGWGTGWENTTFGSRLQEDEDFMETIIGEYKLSMNKNRQAGDIFPESRRVAVRETEENISLTSPLGWTLVEMTRIK